MEFVLFHNLVNFRLTRVPCTYQSVLEHDTRCANHAVLASSWVPSNFGKRPLAKIGKKMIDLTAKLGEINDIEQNISSKSSYFRLYNANHIVGRICNNFKKNRSFYDKSMKLGTWLVDSNTKKIKGQCHAENVPKWRPSCFFLNGRLFQLIRYNVIIYLQTSCFLQLFLLK